MFVEIAFSIKCRASAGSVIRMAHARSQSLAGAMSEGEMSALFVPFGLAPADLGGGTGLGLQVALGYAKQMGGELGSAYPASGASAAIADASAP
jgi:C4-dicarboxylate-specific signal transduction histidine kinase